MLEQLLRRGVLGAARPRGNPAEAPVSGIMLIEFVENAMASRAIPQRGRQDCNKPVVTKNTMKGEGKRIILKLQSETRSINKTNISRGQLKKVIGLTLVQQHNYSIPVSVSVV